MLDKKISCIIIDDEPIAQRIIERFIEKVPYLELIVKCDNAIEGLSKIQDLKPDLVFVDIKMPEMTGLELASIIKSTNLKIVFTTAYSEYALDGFELEAVDYLLKPISFTRFLKATNKVHELVSMHRKLESSNASQQSKKTLSELFESYNFWVKQDGKLVFIDFNDVIMVKGMKDYVQVILKDRKIMTHMTMKKIESILPYSLFLRVNRSCIVKKTSIKAISGSMVETSNGEEILIGTTYRDLIKREINEQMNF